jgi:multidrug resistance efflux pump
VDLDPRDYQAALNQTQVQLLQAQHETPAQQPNVPETEVMQETNIANIERSGGRWGSVLGGRGTQL